MKTLISKLAPGLPFCVLLGLVGLAPTWASAQQWNPPPAYMPQPSVPGLSPRDNQRNALLSVQGEVRWFRNATRTAPNLVNGGYDSLVQRFQLLRAQYNAFKLTLSPAQLSQGANQLSEIEAGLDLIQEAFADFEAAAASSRPSRGAFQRLCRVLDQAVGEWGRELDRVSRSLRVGW